MALRDLFPQEVLERRRAALEAYEAWEAERPVVPPPEDLFERLDALRELLPPELRVPRADDDYEGIRRMHAALSVLGVSR